MKTESRMGVQRPGDRVGFKTMSVATLVGLEGGAFCKKVSVLETVFWVPGEVESA